MQLMNPTDKILQDPVTAETLAAAAQNGGIPFTMDQFNQQQTAYNLNNVQPTIQLAQPTQEIAPATVQEQAVEQAQNGMLGDASELENNLRAAQQAEIERRMEPPPTLNMMARQFAGQILDAKNTYAQGEALYNDEKTRDKGAEVMKLAHTAAMKARAGLENMGINPDEYGLNGSATDVADAIGQNDMRAMSNIFYGDMAPSSGKYYRQMNEYLQSQGYGPRVASAVAEKQAMQYQSDRMNTLMEAFNTYGHTDTAITPQGELLLQKIMQEDIPTADYLISRYAGPQQEYAFRKQMGLAEQAHNYKQADIDRKGAYDMQKAKIGAEAKLKAAQISAAARERAAQISASRPRSSGGGGGNGSRGGLSKSQNGLLNKLKTLREYAYQSMGTVYNPGNTFSDEDDHNVDEYRQALVEAKKSGDVDEEDREWLQEQLNELENTYTAILRVVRNTQ